MNKKMVVSEMNYDEMLELVRDENISEKLLLELVKYGDYFIKMKIALHPNVTAYLLRKLMVNCDLIIKRCIAENPKTPIEILEELVNQESDFGVMIAIIQNPNVTDSILYNIAKYNHELVVLKAVYNCSKEVETTNYNAALASNGFTPSCVLEKLLESECDYVRQELALNSSVSNQILLELVKDDDIIVRSNIIMNIRLNFEERRNDWTRYLQLQEALSEDNNKSIRAAVAGLPKVSYDILKKFSKDSSSKVRKAALLNSYTLDFFEDFVDDECEEIRVWVAKKSLSEGAFEKLAKDSSDKVRLEVAKNKKTPREILCYFAGDKNNDVVFNACYNLEVNHRR